MSLTNTPDITVNGKTISAAMIDAEVQHHPAESRRQAMVKAAETLIIGELVTQKAMEKGIPLNPKSDAIEQNSQLIDSLLASEVCVPEATTEECERYYSANKGTFKTAPLIEASHILIASDPKDLEHRAESHALAVNLIHKLQGGESTLGELAKQFSSCPSKDVDGSLGQLSYGQTVREFERQVFAASEGLMPQPVETRYGYHVVLVARKVDGKPLSFDMVREKIKQYLNDKVHRKALSQYLHRLVSEADIQGFKFEFDDSMLMQ